MKKNSMIRYVALYTLVWLGILIVLYFIFRVNGKSFVFKDDGLTQHFTAFNYLCDFISNLINNHKVSLYDFHIGQGSDVLTTLNSYDFTDLVSWFAALFFPLSRLGRYTLMIFIKLYLTGMTFSICCFCMEKKNNIAILSGAIVYTFSSAVLVMWARHPNFASASWLLPLLLAGVEKLIRTNKKWLLIIAVFISIVTNFYTFYMNILLVAAYVLIGCVCNMISTKETRIFKDEMLKCWKMIVAGVIGILFSMVFLLPTIYAYMMNARVMSASGYLQSVIHYPKEFYIKFFENFFVAYMDAGYYTYIGINVFAFIPAILLFSKKKKYLKLKSCIVVSMVMLCIPMMGSIMNGMGYAVNRFSIVLPLYFAFALVELYSELEETTSKEKYIIFSVISFYVITCLLHTETNSNILKYTAIIMIVWVGIYFGLSSHYRIKNVKCAIVIICALFQVYFIYSPSAGNYLEEYYDKEDVSSALIDSSSIAPKCQNSEFYRVETKEVNPNLDIHTMANGTDLYWSMIPSKVYDYYGELALASVSANCRLRGLDGRTGLAAIGSVKYYTCPKNDSSLVPYGYTQIESDSDKYKLFENLYALPIGYTYRTYITKDVYDSMNALEKEQALLTAAVIDEDIVSVQKADIQTEIIELNYDVEETKGVLVLDNKIKVTSKNGVLELVANIPDDYEVYVYMDNIQLENGTSSEVISVMRVNENKDYQVERSTRVSNNTYNWPAPRDAVSFNLGVGGAGENKFVIKFQSEAEMTYDDIKIFAQPMSYYRECISELREYTLQDVTVEGDNISGTISVPEARILQFSVPYSKGWKVMIDGEMVEPFMSDIMYMAVELDEGSHIVELKYVTPYLKEGFIISLVTALLTALYYMVIKSKNA